jgi:hypothetical protein
LVYTELFASLEIVQRSTLNVFNQSLSVTGMDVRSQLLQKVHREL